MLGNIKELRSANPAKAGLEKTGLYHSFRLPNGALAAGAMSLSWQQDRLESFRIPEDLTGKRVLDIGPWDGYYTFEMERRGAEVTAIDYVDLDTFRALHRAYHSRARYICMDIYELDVAKVGAFDIVLCLGVLYHLKHPLLALEKLCSISRDVCVVDTFVVDGEEWPHGSRAPIPYSEFYEHGELAGQLDNWSGPTVSVVEAWIRSAGFAMAEVSRVTAATACVLAHRKWRGLPPAEGTPVEILGLNSHLNTGRSFQSHKEEYIELWCAWTEEMTPPLDSIFPEVDDFGVAPLASALTCHGLLVSLRLPPGLRPGRHEARLRIGSSGWSASVEFYVDLPQSEVRPVITAIQDGITWMSGEVDWRNGGWMTVWVDGLTAEADAGNTVVFVADIPHAPEAVHVSTGQVNVKLRALSNPGLHDVAIVHRGARSEVVHVRIVGNPPAIRGLEGLELCPIE